MNIKPRMRNNMKKQIFILLAIMVIAIGAYAQVTLQSFQIGPNYLQGTSLKVPNINVSTPFKFNITVSRGVNSGGGSVAGNCTIKLYYTENQSSDSNIPDDPSSLVLLTKNITSSEYDSYNRAVLTDLDASLPANKQYGKILIRIEFLDNQNINRISYSTTRNGIYIVPIQPPGGIDPTHLAKMQAMGFATEYIANFNSSYYLVEGDILINKSSLSVSNPVYALNNDKEHNVNIWVKSVVSANSTWDNAILLAIGAWNANPNSDIKLHLVRQYGTLDTQPPYDIVIDSDQGLLGHDQVKAVEYPIGNGKTGGFIMANLDYNFTSADEAVNNMIHAIGHSLSFKHRYLEFSIMKWTSLANFSNSFGSFPNQIDSPVINAMYPVNPNSVIIPYISGIANLSHGSEQSYDMSYYVPGVTYSWSATAGSGAAPDFSWATQVRLPEVFFDSGNYQLQCTISSGKYTTPITVTKNIIVQ
jgi:hypothetical protein